MTQYRRPTSPEEKKELSEWAESIHIEDMGDADDGDDRPISEQIAECREMNRKYKDSQK